MNPYELRRIEKVLSDKLIDMREASILIYEEAVDNDGLNRNKSLQSMHALIGGKNNTFVDSVRMQFQDPKDFIARWVKGLIDKYGHKEYVRDDGSTYNYILIELIKNEYFKKYIFTFLERNFYRNLIPRIRHKPDDILWELWIGGNDFILGLLITPVIRNSIWTNDVSEIRRTNYKYWTIGHIMKTGFVDPDSKEKIEFCSHEELFVFYRSILKKLSKSQYEKGIYDRYIDYLMRSECIEDEPLLIPEIRHAGLEKQHLYRLDFTILNPHTHDYIGFELSPSSSHMSVTGIKSGKTQKQMNKDLSIKWDKEMKKRNDYFAEYGIYTITYTDEQLQDMDAVFSNIASFLSKRKEMVSLSDQLKRLKAIS